ERGRARRARAVSRCRGAGVAVAVAPRYCPGANANGGYLCETGQCCGESGCCTYYYELWWFWLLWTALILFSCCCAYRHRRAKLRLQQQQRQRDISLLAYQGASSFPSSMLDLSFLPSTPPPPYSSVFTAARYPQPPRAEYCEDSDVAADESQYRHRRLTGDSGIEVCRCHVEDEDGDMEKKKPDERKCAGGAALHDSADCPVRSRGSSDDDAGLCETSPDEVVIPVETV
uniref:WW domain binding protein 1 n=1 Tax=Neogobius melanostomus TaxID=47308 RepID=A0A8C6V0U7_9GOBI